MKDYSIVVGYEWFNDNASVYNYFIISQSDERDVTERTYTVCITGVKNEKT